MKPNPMSMAAVCLCLCAQAAWHGCAEGAEESASPSSSVGTPNEPGDDGGLRDTPTGGSGNTASNAKPDAGGTSDNASTVDPGPDGGPAPDPELAPDATVPMPRDGGAGILGWNTFVPSNFDPVTLDPIAAGEVTNIHCDAELDTSGDSPGFTTWCGGSPEPPVVVVEQVDGPELAVVVTRDLAISLAGSLRVTGSRPVVLAAFGNATIDGDIDVSASGTTPGPGGNAACGDAKGGDGSGSAILGGSGGGGGGFGSGGGRGGSGGEVLGFPDNGGATRGNPDVVPLVGGCLGGLGGGCEDGGGNGGGALQISASGELFVSSTLRARGGDGAPGCGTNGGGNGGGSGGAVVLEADVVDLSGITLDARGGNGGDGAGITGAKGGAGSTDGTTAANGQSSILEGGGGGGGGYGRIAVRATGTCTACPE